MPQTTAEPRGSHEPIFRSSAAEHARATPNAATLSGHGRREAGRGRRLPARGPSGGLSLTRRLGRLRPIRALSQAAEAAGDQIDGVDPAAVALVAALPQAPAHMDQVALGDVLSDVGLRG